MSVLLPLHPPPSFHNQHTISQRGTVEERSRVSGLVEDITHTHSSLILLSFPSPPSPPNVHNAISRRGTIEGRPRAGGACGSQGYIPLVYILTQHKVFHPNLIIGQPHNKGGACGNHVYPHPITSVFPSHKLSLTEVLWREDPGKVGLVEVTDTPPPLSLVYCLSPRHC